MIKTRVELKSYFVKNAIPTEGNFADLIDSLFIQTQDGVYKSDTQPLSVTAAPGNEKRALRLYKTFPQPNPDWTIALNPTEGAASAPGLGVVNAAGATKLFIHDNGRVGIGTIAPPSELGVNGTVTVTGAFVPSVGNAENRGIQFPADPGGGGGDRAFIRYFVETGERTKLLIGNNNDADDRVSLMQAGAERLTVYDGKVGINQQTPTHALHVQGDAYLAGPLYFAPSSDPHYKIELFAWPSSAAIRVKGFGAVALATGAGDILTVTGDRVGINNTNPGATLDVTARVGTWGGWLEAVRFSRPEHSAITHPGGKLLLGLHGDRSFYFADTNAGRYVFQIQANTGNVLVPHGRLEAAGGVKANEIGLGTQVHGATSFPYETIQMNPGHNLRVWFGTREKFVFAANGFFQVVGAGGEIGYLGGDGAGGDIQVGSASAGIMTLAAYNIANGQYMDFTCRTLRQTSDERLKINIEPVGGALAKLSKLRAVRFDWKDAVSGAPSELGVIAQEVRTHVPEAVFEGRGGALGVSYQALTALVIEALKEQQHQILELRAAVDKLSAAKKTK